MRAFAAELVAKAPDVLVAHSTPVAEALARENRQISMVFVLVSDPLSSGLAANFAAPEGIATGFTNFIPAIGAKWVQFLWELIPQLLRVAVLFNPDTAPNGGSMFLQPVEEAARNLSIETVPAPVGDATELDNIIAAHSRNENSAMVVMPDIFTTVHRAKIIALVAKHRLPTMFPFRYFATDGGLISYGIDVSDVFKRTATYVDKILRGTKPSSLPIQHPSKFELVINRKEATVLGLTVPRILLARADNIID
jgi:putative ABC transport system substrate-binding protein